jgi:hypothetical protein
MLQCLRTRVSRSLTRNICTAHKPAKEDMLLAPFLATGRHAFLRSLAFADQRPYASAPSSLQGEVEFSVVGANEIHLAGNMLNNDDDEDDMGLLGGDEDEDDEDEDEDEMVSDCFAHKGVRGGGDEPLRVALERGIACWN